MYELNILYEWFMYNKHASLEASSKLYRLTDLLILRGVKGRATTMSIAKKV